MTSEEMEETIRLIKKKARADSMGLLTNEHLFTIYDLERLCYQLAKKINDLGEDHVQSI